MSDTNKLAADVPALMHGAAQHMKKLASANVELVKRAESAEHELRIIKIARLMEQRGLNPNLGFEEKVAALRSFTTEKLASTEQAIEMAAGGVRLGNLQPTESGKTASGDHGSSESGSDELENFIESQAALTA